MLLDFWIDSLRSRHLDHDTRDLLRLGLYQLFVLETPEHAAVFETVALAKPKGRSLINGVLRSATSVSKADLVRKASEQDLSVRTSHPQFLVDRWVKSFGAKDIRKALCDWNNRPAPV